MYSRLFFLDKGTCQGKLASVNEALIMVLSKKQDASTEFKSAHTKLSHTRLKLVIATDQIPHRF